MTRDMDLVRQVLLVVEASEKDRWGGARPDVSEKDPRVQYHLRLLIEAGLVQAVGTARDGNICVQLTWEGHEFVELVRCEQNWARAKYIVEKRTGGNSFAGLKAVLTELALQAVSDTEAWAVVEGRKALVPVVPDKQEAAMNGSRYAAWQGENGWYGLRRIHRLTTGEAIEAVKHTNSSRSLNTENVVFPAGIWRGYKPEYTPLYAV